jgi:hypothetical protein
MTGLIILALLVIYILIGRFIVIKTYEKFQTKKSRYIALAIVLLIPTWDIIIGYPIYKYLCMTQAGVHIYKTVDNVEGIYIGKQYKSTFPHIPYKGYKYIDYMEEDRGEQKYFRTYWLDSNTSKSCVLPQRKFGDYAEDFRQGKCIVKDEISENEVSRWEWIDVNQIMLSIPLIRIEVKRTDYFTDRQTKQVLAEKYSVWWQGGVLGLIPSFSSGRGGIRCEGDIKYNEYRQSVLKPKI